MKLRIAEDNSSAKKTDEETKPIMRMFLADMLSKKADYESELELLRSISLEIDELKQQISVETNELKSGM